MIHYTGDSQTVRRGAQTIRAPWTEKVWEPLHYTFSSAVARPITVRLRHVNMSNELHKDWIYSVLRFNIKFVLRSKQTPPSQSGPVDSEQGNSLFCANHSKYINTSCEQNIAVLSVRSGSTHSNHWALEGLGKNPMERNHLGDPCVLEKKTLTWS
jgi:hypothetical protein